MLAKACFHRRRSERGGDRPRGQGELQRIESDIAAGRHRLVFVAPERLLTPRMLGLLRRLPVRAFAIDEAHCISHWGHDFRPDYLQLGELVRALPESRVVACTATATPVVRDEILARLNLPADTPQMVRGFARENLVLRAAEVSGAAERSPLVDALLA